MNSGNAFDRYETNLYSLDNF